MRALCDAQTAAQTLHEAAKGGDEAALKRLIAEGRDVDAKDRRGITPLGVAVGFNKIPCVRCLLDAGADVHLTDARGSTVLHYAAGLSPCTSCEICCPALEQSILNMERSGGQSGQVIRVALVLKGVQRRQL